MPTVRKSFKFNWRHNDSSVYVDDTVPRIFEKEADIRPTIVVDLKDKQFSIDSGTIKFYLEGFDITSATTITAIPDGYRIVYVPTIDFTYNQTVNILVRAANSHGVYMPDYSYHFITQRKRLYEEIEEVIKTIASGVNWDDITDEQF